MKKKYVHQTITSFLLLVLSSVSLMVWGQDSTVSSHKTITTSTTNQFVVQPWMWIAGGIVVLIVIVLLMSNRSTTEVSRTTVIKNNPG